jgi:predicted  nucleic acid-binding Zn-ribbon protein
MNNLLKKIYVEITRIDLEVERLNYLKANMLKDKTIKMKDLQKEYSQIKNRIVKLEIAKKVYFKVIDMIGGGQIQ